MSFTGGDPYANVDLLPIPGSVLALAKQDARERRGPARWRTREDWLAWLKAAAGPARPRSSAAAAVAARPVGGRVPPSRDERLWFLVATKSFRYRDSAGRMQEVVAGQDYAATSADVVLRFPHAWARSARPIAGLRTSSRR